jgi:type I restriction enzyme M protein
MLESELRSKINLLWDKFWSGGIANPLTAIEQMSYLIFMKRIEDQDNKLVKRHASSKGDYSSLFDGKIKIGNSEYEKKDCRWSEWKHLPADEMLIRVREVVFPFLKNLHNGENTFFAEHMKDAVFLIPKASLLQEAVAIIDELNISMRNVDTQGDIYEYLLDELKTSGKNGQFRTPRHIIRMMVKLVDPDINDRIIDPACGTGGFLINAYEHILAKYTPKDQLKIDDDGEIHGAVGSKITKKEHWEKLWGKTFYGYDFDTTMVRIGLMNMILHGIKKPHVDYLDSLSKRNSIRAEYNVVLANPPFTGSIDRDDINDAFKIKTAKTELLFLELFYKLLEMGGRAAVIVPNGVLFGSSNAHKDVRKMILDNCQLQAVISMPSGVFKPYSGVGTAIMVFTKGGSTEKVWFYDMKADGYSLDDKRNRIDGKGNIPDIVEKFKTKADSKNSILVDIKDIKKDGEYYLSYSKYRPDEHEAIEYEDPEKIIERSIKQEEEILAEFQKLKRQLK